MAKISQLPVLASPRGNEVVVVADPADASKTKAANLSGLVGAAVKPALDRAEAFASASQDAALAALLAVADGVYTSIADGLAATDGSKSQGFYVRDDTGGLKLYLNEAGVARPMVTFATQASLRAHGINLWEEAKWNGSTDTADMRATTDAIKNVMEDAARWGVGVVNCGGREKTYVCGGDYASFGTQKIIGKSGTRTIPFPRYRIPLVSNVELRGASRASRPCFRAAPGELDPGPLFGTPFWLSQSGQRENVVFRWIELDGNASQQRFTQYRGGGTDEGMWIQGHAITSGSLKNFTAYECQVHGWRGHGFFGFSGSDYGVASDDWQVIGCDVFDNMQGGAQIDNMARFRSERNWYHGDGGWTALGPNFEMHAEDGRLLDIYSVNDIFDGRDGLSCVEATVRDFGGFAGLDTDSAAAQAARVHTRRGLWLSGNYYTVPTGNTFKRQRGRVHIVAPKLYQATIGGGGFDRVHLTDPQIENTFEDIRRHWPPPTAPIYFGGAAGGYDVTGFDQLVIRDAMLNVDCAGPSVWIGNFEKVKISAQITGGRDSAVRLELCGGKVDVHVKNCGTKTDRAYWKALNAGIADKDADALVGSTSAAVAVFGSRGPLEINAHAVETRSGAARQMQCAVYANVGVDWVATATGSATGMDIGLKDVNGTVFNRGLIVASQRVVPLSGPVTIDRSLVVAGPVDFVSLDGDLNVSLRAPDGAKRKINFMDNGGLEFQLSHLANGDLQMNVFDDGVGIDTPITLTNDGHVRMLGNWQRPIELTYGPWIWWSADNKLRVGTSRPTKDDDGTPIALQTGV